MDLSDLQKTAQFMHLMPYATKHKVIKKFWGFHTDINSQRQRRLLARASSAPGNKGEKALSPYWPRFHQNLLVSFCFMLHLTFSDWVSCISGCPQRWLCTEGQSSTAGHPAFTSVVLRLYLHGLRAR